MPIRGTRNLPEGKTTDQIEKGASGTTPGWFRAVVSAVYEKDSDLKMEITLRDGRKHTETLWNPVSSERPGRLRQRRSAFAIRLGLVPPEAKGSHEFDWLDAIGKEVIVHFVEGTPKGNAQKFICLDWMGLYAADDPRGLEQLSDDGADSRSNPASGDIAVTKSKMEQQVPPRHAVPCRAGVAACAPNAAKRERLCE